MVAQMVKNLPAMWETRVRSLGQEDLLDEEMATHSSILAWKIPWAEEPGGLQSVKLPRVGHDSATSAAVLRFHEGVGSSSILLDTAAQIGFRGQFSWSWPTSCLYFSVDRCCHFCIGLSPLLPPSKY